MTATMTKIEEACTKGRFLKDVQDHGLQVIQDNGLYRHLKFRREGKKYAFWIDIVTWPGYLCIASDCGTFVFRRIEDMFEFFRDERGEMGTNPHYWSEKIQAQDRDGVTKYSEEVFKNNVREAYELHTEDEEYSEEAKEDLWKEIEEDIFWYSDNEHDAYRAAMEFTYRGERIFQDFWEYSSREFTFSYLWCTYALVWGIQKYDEGREKALPRITHKQLEYIKALGAKKGYDTSQLSKKLKKRYGNSLTGLSIREASKAIVWLGGNKPYESCSQEEMDEYIAAALSESGLC